MSLIEIILRLAVVSLLISYLVQKHWQRMRNVDEHYECDDSSKWTGATIYTTNLMPSIARVRQDYLAARPVNIHDGGYHHRLCAVIRRAIQQCAFFRHLKD